ncbi:MAG: hypothetical protein ACK52I_03575 [Pseudomonadota bacterium]|jgi:hypothetical protein
MKPPKVSLSKIEQEIDLKEFFDADLAESRGIKEAIAQAVIDKIVERTEGGEGLRFSSNGAATPIKLKSPYSKMYAESLEFKAAGKSKNKVNMTLSGDMLAGIDVGSVEGNKIKIYIRDDQVPKAFNHLTGDTVPARPFFGISKSEMEDIASKFRVDVEAARPRTDFSLRTEDDALTALDRLSNILDDND